MQPFVFFSILSGLLFLMALFGLIKNWKKIIGFIIIVNLYFFLLNPEIIFFQITTPEPSKTGGNTIEELSQMYTEAHKKKDLDLMRDLIVGEFNRPRILSMRKTLEEIFLGLFELELDGVKILEFPEKTETKCLDYLCPGMKKPLIETLGSDDLHGKMILTGWRPDGTKIKIDPGVGVKKHLERYYLWVQETVAADAASAIKNATEPKYRPIPLGTDGIWIIRLMIVNDWAKALRMLEDLEAKEKKKNIERKGHP